MTGDTGLRKGWKRLLVILCTLLLAGSVLLVFGVMGWAQDSDNEAPQDGTGTEAETQEEGTETPAEAVSEEQPPAEEEPKGELTVEYWEPQLGDRAVYYVNDFINDTHGQTYGTSALGYWDDFWVYDSTFNPLRSIRPDELDYSSSYYKNVAAISDMNPVYFDLEGPWYFNMTTPWKVVEEVIGIHEAPDAHLFPYATYAVRDLIICSGGHRMLYTYYNSNNPDEQTWNRWGFTKEYIPESSDAPVKDIIYYYSPHDPELKISHVYRSFPLMLGVTGSIDAVDATSGKADVTSGSGTFEVIAEGQVTAPGGTYDALLIQYNITSPYDGSNYIEYRWFAQNVGTVVYARSLPDILGPTFGESTGYRGKSGGYFYMTEGMLVMEEYTSTGGGEQQ
jgi:hypothetical protein